MQLLGCVDMFAAMHGARRWLDEINVEIVGDSRSPRTGVRPSEKSARKFDGTMTEDTARSRGRYRPGARRPARRPRLLPPRQRNHLRCQRHGTTGVENQRRFRRVRRRRFEAWAETTTEGVRDQRRQALATAGSFGALFAPFGIIGPEAAKQSQRLTELGADLACSTTPMFSPRWMRSGRGSSAKPNRSGATASCSPNPGCSSRRWPTPAKRPRRR